MRNITHVINSQCLHCGDAHNGLHNTAVVDGCPHCEGSCRQRRRLAHVDYIDHVIIYDAATGANWDDAEDVVVAIIRPKGQTEAPVVDWPDDA